MDLNAFLKQNEFYLDEKIADILEAVLSNGRKGILLRGPAGTGKTQLTWLVSKYLSAEYVFFQCSFGTSEDDLLYKYIPSEETKSGIRITLGPIPRALVASKSRKTVLVLDEFDKTRPSADALLLDLLQNCRTSLYIDESETVVQGNPENLVVFLTSNDMREFSEPLLRRVITINLPLLDTRTVYNMLSKRFSKEISVLLTQIYDDTVKAGLRKVATIQELMQLGEILEQKVSVPLDQLLRMFIIKYDDDWEKYKQYITSRNAYSFTSNNTSESIEQYYEPNGLIAVHTEQKQQESVTNVTSLLEKIKHSVRKFEMQAIPEKVVDGSEVCLKIPDEDFEAYTAVIKELQPEPSNDPSVLGKFRYVFNEINAVISNEPLTITEAHKLTKRLDSIEVYYEGEVMTDSLETFITYATKIKYYTKDKIYFYREEEQYNSRTEERLILERTSDTSYYVRGYVKKEGELQTVFLRKLNDLYSSSEEPISVLSKKEYKNVYIPLYVRVEISRYMELEKVKNLVLNINRSNILIERINIKPEKYYDIYLTLENGKAIITLGSNIAKALLNKKQSFNSVDEIIKALEGLQ